MTDDQYHEVIARLDGLHADMQMQSATVQMQFADQRRLTQFTADEMRRRISTAENTMINEIRDLSARFDRVEERLTRLERQTDA